MQSKAATVDQYLAELPPDRRAAVSAVRDVFLKNMDKGFQERMAYGMIGYSVPHSTYPAGYHCDPSMPLPYACLASQKNHMSLSLMSLYSSCIGGAESEMMRWFRTAWAKSGKKLDMGKACIRFKKVEDLPLDVLAEAIRRVPVKTCIAIYESALQTMDKISAARKKPAAKPAKKSPKSAKKATKKVAKKK